jgi:hypothetical protein
VGEWDQNSKYSEIRVRHLGRDTEQSGGSLHKYLRDRSFNFDFFFKLRGGADTSAIRHEL